MLAQRVSPSMSLSIRRLVQKADLVFLNSVKLPSFSLYPLLVICLDPTPTNRLPAEYKQLEARVDALQGVHQKLLKVSKVHETESVSWRSPDSAVKLTISTTTHPILPSPSRTCPKLPHLPGPHSPTRTSRSALSSFTSDTS